jgi:hypothetical protein
MSSDSTTDPFASNERTGMPNADGVVGTFDMSKAMTTTFHRGASGLGPRMTNEPSAPGSERVPANASANPHGRNLQHHLNGET